MKFKQLIKFCWPNNNFKFEFLFLKIEINLSVLLRLRRYVRCYWEKDTVLDTEGFVKDEWNEITY